MSLISSRYKQYEAKWYEQGMWLNRVTVQFFYFEKTKLSFLLDNLYEKLNSVK